MIDLHKKPKLNGKELYKIYIVDLGVDRSVREVSKILISQGVMNTKTGQPFTEMAIWLSLWRWAVNNSDLAYQMFNEAMRDEGKFYTQDEWDEFIQPKAWMVFYHNKKRFDKWLSQNGKKNRMPASSSYSGAGA